LADGDNTWLAELTKPPPPPPPPPYDDDDDDASSMAMTDSVSDMELDDDDKMIGPQLPPYMWVHLGVMLLHVHRGVMLLPVHLGVTRAPWSDVVARAVSVSDGCSCCVDVGITWPLVLWMLALCV
jgi:hypothetical protein